MPRSAPAKNDSRADYCCALRPTTGRPPIWQGRSDNRLLLDDASARRECNADGAGDYGPRMLPVLPPNPPSNDLNVSIRQRLDGLDAGMPDFRRLKYLAHGLR